jgi:WD40 repeat protein/tRNA A-37 threonylcarbamoyl transferase component Bud32
VNDDGREDKARDDSARGRWSRNTALARLAFGASTHGAAHATPASFTDAMAHALAHGGRLEVDLDDPAQRDFGEYELLEQIGQGGMGVVYRARQRGLDREVAIKLQSAGQWASEDLVESLRREAQHAARLQHPNIVVVYGIGEQAGLVYYAMQLVRGHSLSQKLDAEGPMPPREAARLLRTIAEAVDYAHRLGVLHLDLKPANVLIDADGVPHIADFGLARQLDHVLEERRISGTPNYMAPEQASPDHAALSPATDVWALGAVLYEMLTGHPPFEAEDPAQTLQLLQEGAVRRPSEWLPVPRDLEAICLRCLGRDPAARYPSARALADELGRYLEGRAVRARPLNVLQRVARWARREPKLAGIAGFACVALLVGVVATGLQWRRAEGNALQAGRALGAQRALALQQAHAIGRDFGALPGLAANLRAAVDAGDIDAIALERRRLGLALAAYPRLIDRFVMPQKPVSLALSPDGRRLAVGTVETAEVLLFDTTSGRQLWRATLAAEPAFFGHGNFSKVMRRVLFSPDGRYVIVNNWWPTPVISPSGVDNWRIDVATGEVAHPQKVFPQLRDATFSDDGRYALLRREDLHQVQLWDAVRWKPLSAMAPYNPIGPAYLIAPDARFIATWGSGGIDILDPTTLSQRWHFASPGAHVAYSAWAVDPRARWLAIADSHGAVSIADPATGKLRRLLPGPATWARWLQFASDGAWLAAGSQDGSVWVWQREDDFTVGRRLDIRTPAVHVTVDPGTGLVRVGDEDSVGVWQLSGLGEADRSALPRVPLFRHSQEIPSYASDLHAASGLLASASLDGEVRLWRLPPMPLRAGTAPPQSASRLAFDGTHYVAVDGVRATVMRAADDTRASQAFVHAQPIGFAALSADGRTLVTSSGRELRVFDWQHGRLRFPPLALPNSPMKLALQGARAYVSYIVERGRPLTEAVSVFSLEDGRALARPLEVPDGINALSPSPDGVHLAVLTNAGLQVLDGATLQRAGAEVKTQKDEHIFAAAVGNDRIAFATASPDGVRVQDLRSTRAPTFTATAEPPAAVTLSADGKLRAAFLPGNRLIQLIGGEKTRVVDAPNGTEFARAAAFTPDGSTLAQALVDGVLLLDSKTGEWLAPPLRAPIPAPDVVSQVAFSPDGTRLLARTWFGRWLFWRLDRDDRPVADIEREVQILSPVRGAPVPASAEARRALRARDPGPMRQTLPRFGSVTCPNPTPPVLARAASTSPRLLALAPPGAPSPHVQDVDHTRHTVANLCTLPLGVQRLGGVDFDVRASVAATQATTDALFDRRARGLEGGLPIVSGIAVPPVVARVGAFELLATSATFVQDPAPEQRPAQANLVVHYDDGSVARMPVRYARDVGMWIEPPPDQSHVAWRVTLPRVETGTLYYQTVDLYRVRLANPHPERAVRSVDIEAMPVTWNGVAVLAITVDPMRTP